MVGKTVLATGGTGGIPREYYGYAAQAR